MPYKTFKLFNRFPELICAFSTRKNGMSKGIYSSLNLGLNTGDLAETVERNRQIFFNQLGIKKNEVAFAEQIHSANVKVIDKPGFYFKTDAMVSEKEGLFLTIQTADCFPVFVYFPAKKVIAIIHVGWKGAAQGIVGNVFQILSRDFNALPGDMFVAVGPGLERKCFEVGDDVASLFPADFLKESKYGGKKYLNLQRFILTQLINDLSIPQKHVYVDSSCTKCLEEEYYSYRRDGVKSGRMMGIIGIKKGVH